MPIINGQISGKFKEVLIPFNELPEEALHSSDFLLPLENLYRNEIISEAETAALFVISYHYYRTGNLKYQKKHIFETIHIPSESILLADLPNEFDFLKDTARLFNIKYLYEFIAKIKLRRLPEYVDICLINWMNNSWKLRLENDIIPVFDMLNAQSHGFRYVTLNWKSAYLGTPIENKRDAFEFLLHDLGHAYTFFRPDYNYPGQVFFFQRLKEDMPVLEPLLKEDPIFEKEFEYCLCDMNSHPEHLREYLRGIITSYFLRLNEKAGHDYLEPEEREDLNLLIEKLSCLKKIDRHSM